LVQGVAAGVAATTHAQTVSGDDPQLTNARTPTAHQASHVSGSDQIPLAGASAKGLLAQLTGNTTDYVGGDNACHSLVTALAGLLVPTGTVLDFAGSTAPTGFVLCNGASYATTGAMAALFAVVGYTFGGSGANFNVPDLRGVTSIGAGQGSGLTNRALGTRGGEETHQLTTAELASHTHTITVSNHSHPLNYLSNYTTTGASAAFYPGAGTGSVTGTTQPTATAANSGSDTAHNTMPPFLVLNKIIKT
jgi:microcystin-dependent protein